MVLTKITTVGMLQDRQRVYLACQAWNLWFPFFSGSQPLALKSQQMTTSSVPEMSEIIIIWVKTLIILDKKVVVWWLYNDNLRAREWEWEEKETTNSAPKDFHVNQRFRTKFSSINCNHSLEQPSRKSKGGFYLNIF